MVLKEIKSYDSCFSVNARKTITSRWEWVFFNRIFATKEDAQEAIQKSILLPGFCDHQNDFVIREIEIDKDLI